MTTHSARKTFAFTVLVYNDVPIEVVTEILDHRYISVPEDNYGKIVKKKVSLVMNRLKKK